MSLIYGAAEGKHPAMQRGITTSHTPGLAGGIQKSVDETVYGGLSGKQANSVLSPPA
ncbi:hypothetical protein [Sporomusa sphaeroides]|uniref:hypothetical protein n=1 Tax=Sporomusa sphaeroides TaxID=47679 RepID=UPI0031597B68